ncbi:hypothetical protein, partial [Chloroflexus aurantiacus]|uniref:hypothetical protein n=1 Tax=Chloroflexus aurantiacus TaxID=1108 RepID=UPI002357AD88
FQTPSLRGNALLISVVVAGALLLGMFQTPSLRGNALLSASGSTTTTATASFKPLHCGAMLCWSAAAEPTAAPVVFQTPSLRGNALLDRDADHALALCRVSNPFI